MAINTPNKGTGSEILKAKLELSIKSLPNPSLVLKKKSALIDLFDKVAIHQDIFPQLISYRDALSGLEINFITPKKGTPGATNSQQNDWFEAFFDQFDSWTFMRNAVIARDYGFTVLEITEYGEFDGKTVPVKVEPCPQKYFFFDRNRVLRMYSNQASDGIDVMATWPNKFILVQHEPTLLNPYGVGLLDIAYWLAVGLNGNFEFMLQFAEEDGRDKWLGKYPPGAKDEEISDLLNMLVQLRNNGVAAIPDGTKIESMSNTGRSSSTNLYKDVDEILRRKIEKLWTGTDLTMQVQGKGGYSSSQSGLDIREDAVESGKRLCLSAVNQLIAAIQNINGMPVERLPIRLQSPRKISKDAAEIDQIYFNAGMKPTPQLLMKRGYDEEDFILSSEANKIADNANKPASDANFDAPDDYDGLLSSFEAYRERLKKKS
jgi:phage gp29-like protein